MFRWSEHLIFEIDFGNSISKQILVKVLQDKKEKSRVQEENIRPNQSAKLEYEALTFIYNAFSGGRRSGITAVRPVAYYPELETVALEYLPGKSFLSLLLEAGQIPRNKSKCKIAEQTAFKSGELLSVIHNTRNGDYPRYENFDHISYLEKLRDKAETLEKLNGTKPVRKQIEKILNRIDIFLNYRDEKVIVSFSHGDYYPNNIVRLPDGRIFTIDTTLHTINPVEQDIAKFLAGVSITKREMLCGSLGMHNKITFVMCQAFIRGYLSSGNYNQRVLLVFQLLAYLQRWIEILQISNTMGAKLPISLYEKFRITPVMLGKIKLLLEKIEKE